jgi:uncharacterized membrane protein
MSDLDENWPWAIVVVAFVLAMALSQTFLLSLFVFAPFWVLIILAWHGAVHNGTD